MSIVNSIATASTAMKMSNVQEKVSLSILKKGMEQSEQNIMKILDMAPAPAGTTIDYTV